MIELSVNPQVASVPGSNIRYVLLDRHWWQTLPWEQQEPWRVWSRRHGIDPAEVAACPGFLAVDDTARTITYQALSLDEQGKTFLDGDMLARHIAVVQLEAPALPFPEDT